MLREDEHAYRERMEAFVSDLTGTTMAELVLVSIPIPMGIWLLGEVKVRLFYCFFRMCPREDYKYLASTMRTLDIPRATSLRT